MPLYMHKWVPNVRASLARRQGRTPASRAIHAYPQAACSSKPPLIKTLTSEPDFLAAEGGTAWPERMVTARAREAEEEVMFTG